ncbi:competence protein ComK [Lysinibacillus fusiformis]|uniref:competence protein ComK n=2 Tax=Lysinibacillus fusiformis TaxID=28031 RepID=UPI0038036B45
MMHKKDIMSSETMLYMPVYDSFGNLCTRVMEKSKDYISKIPPTKLMDYNLRYYGSSLRGAFDGSKMILGKLNKNPIVVDERGNILWFPSKSPLHPECIWFAVHHIEEYFSVDKKSTKVIFTNGQDIIVDVSVKTIEYRIQRAFLLKYRLERRTKHLLVQYDRVKVFQRFALDMLEDET